MPKMAWHHAAMDIPWEDVQLFLAVAETRSVSGAARRLRVGQPTVSRRLAQLEYRLSARLFNRSVTGATLTAAGERLLGPARKMAEWAGEVGRAAGATDATPRGLVRVTAAPWVCAAILVPFAAWLGRRRPGPRLELLSVMHHLDLVRGEADLALRARAPTEPELTRLRSLEHANAVFVARSLRARLPRKPRLEQLPWVAWAPPWDTLPPNPQLEAAVPGFVPAFTSDHFLVNLAAAEAGLGAIALPDVGHPIFRTSSLVPLPVDLGPFARSAVHLVCARSALDIPRVRHVAEALLEVLDAVTGPGLRRW